MPSRSDSVFRMLEVAACSFLPWEQGVSGIPALGI